MHKFIVEDASFYTIFTLVSRVKGCEYTPIMANTKEQVMAQLLNHRGKSMSIGFIDQDRDLASILTKFTILERNNGYCFMQSTKHENAKLFAVENAVEHWIKGMVLKSIPDHRFASMSPKGIYELSIRSRKSNDRYILEPIHEVVSRLLNLSRSPERYPSSLFSLIEKSCLLVSN